MAKQKRAITLTEQDRLRRSKNMATVSGNGAALTDEDKEYNNRLINHTLAICEIAKGADLSDPESLRDCFIQYMKLCQSDGFRIGNIGACAAMGLNHRTIRSWASGEKRSNDPRYKALADLIISICATSREQMVSDSRINPVIGIFWQRNFDGLRNDTEQTQSATDQTSDSQSTSDYVSKYGQLIDE